MEDKSNSNNSNDGRKIAMTVSPDDVKQEPLDAFALKQGARKSTYANSLNDERDLLIAQLQDQVAKQRDCISHYESIVQLMNYRIMKMKKVLKANSLLAELD